MRKVQPGDPLEIPAATYNAFIDAARAHQANRLGGPPAQAWRQTGIVLIRNDSGGVVPRFGVLAITGPAIDPSDNEREFASRVAVVGDTPTEEDAGRFAVLLEPVGAGRFARACVAGVTVARVEIAAEQHAYADSKPDAVDRLLSGHAGLAQLLWVQPAAQRDLPGVAWALVRLGGGGGSVVHLVTVRQDGGEAGSASTPCTWTYALYSGAEQTPEQLLATDLTPRRRRTAVGAYVAAADGTEGLAYPVGADWVLLDAFDEVPSIEPCEEV